MHVSGTTTNYPARRLLAETRSRSRSRAGPMSFGWVCIVVILAGSILLGLASNGPSQSRDVGWENGADGGLSLGGLGWGGLSRRPDGMEGWIVFGYALSGFALGAGFAFVALMRRGRDGSATSDRVETNAAQAPTLLRDVTRDDLDAPLTEFTHEARIPLNAIVGAADLLMGSTTDAERWVLARGIRADAMGAMLSLQDANEFARLRAGVVNLEREPFDLPSLLESIMELHTPVAERVGVGLILRVDSDVPSELCGDRNRLRRALVELVGRAARRAEGAEVCLHALRRDGSSARTALEFTVSRRASSHVGDMLESSSFEDTGAADLRLKLVDRLARRMGGTLECNDAGDEIKYILKVALEKVGQSISVGSKRCPSIKELVDAPLWIVSHRPLAQAAVMEFSTCLGMRPECLSSAHEAIQRARRLDAPSRVAVFVDIGESLNNDASPIADLAATGVSILTWRESGLLSGGVASDDGVFHLRGRPLTSVSFFDGMIALVGRGATSGARVSTSRGGLERLRRAPRVLLVEDHPVNRRLGMMLLQSLGLPATAVNDGAAAVAAVAGGEFDLALMDCEMPVMDGYEATRRIREMKSVRQPIIVAVTANIGAGERERCLDSGMDDYLRKPLRLAEFRAALTKHGLLESDDRQTGS